MLGVFNNCFLSKPVNFYRLWSGIVLNSKFILAGSQNMEIDKIVDMALKYYDTGTYNTLKIHNEAVGK